MITPLLFTLVLAAPGDVAPTVAPTGAGGTPTGTPGATPKLVVLVTVDQLIPEQLERLAPRLDGGLGRFVRNGRVFRGAELGYSRTETGPGHATLATGTYPSTHGVVGNRFFDRERRQLVYCVGDESTSGVTSEGVSEVGGDVSPRTLRVPALGDLLASEHPASRTVSIAGKDRAAVTMGGRDATAALWWNRSGGGFQSSTYYGGELPEWVLAWNGSWTERYAEFAGGGWTPLTEDLACSGTAPDDRPGEAGVFPGGCTFPHELPDVHGDGVVARCASMAFCTPLVDGFVLSLAAEAVVELDLGGGEAPDLLAVGLSACDVVGHSFGPYSREVTDVLLRADDGLAELFDLLDERLGADGWVACLSADHGVLDLPEALAARGVDAGRIPASELLAMRENILSRFADVFESDLGFDYTGGLVFDPAQIEERQLDPAEVWDLAAVAAREAQWIARAFTFDDLRATADDDPDPLRRLMARSVAEGRGPDVALVHQPWKLLAVPAGTSHGSPYGYDRRIPVVFLGPGFEPGESFEPAGAVDVLPTLLHALGERVPEHVEGRVLVPGTGPGR